MLTSYKIELFVIPVISLFILFIIDFNSAPDYVFFDYQNLNTTEPEDIIAFVFVSMILNMFILIFVHFFRIIKLRHLDKNKFMYNRVVLLVSNLLFFILLITAAIIDSDDDSKIDDDMVINGIVIVVCLFVVFYYLLVFKESKYVYQLNLDDEKSLLDELHHF